MPDAPTGPPDSFLEAVPALLWVCDQEGYRTWFSPEWLRVRGRVAARELGDGWLAGVHGDDRGALADAYFGALAGGHWYTHEYRLLCQDGLYRRVREVARALPDGGLAGACELAGRSRQVDAITAGNMLSQRLHFFEALFQAAPIGIQLFATDGTTLRLNETQRRLLRLPNATDAAGATNILTDPVRMHSGSAEHFRRAIAGEVVEATVHFDAPEGLDPRTAHEEARWVDSTLFPVLDDRGGVQTVVEFTRDVTERVRAEKALRESEEKYRLTVESLNDMVFRTDRAGNIIYVSPATPRQSGYLGDDLRGQPATAVWESAEDAQRFLDQILSQGRVNDFESKMFRKDGKPVWISLNATVMRDEEGHVAGVTGSIRDISERKRMEAALAEAEGRFRRIVETGAEGIYIIDLDGRIEFANEAMAQLVGYSVEELAGMEHRALVAPGRARAREVQRWRKGEVERFELEYRHREGQPVYGVVSVAPMHDGSGRLIGGLTMVTDMTEQVKAQRAQEELVEALRSNAAALEEQAQVLNELRIQAQFLADHDTLTSALNRRAWFEAGTASVGDWCVAVIDIDHFKRINDTFGHPAGDAVLIEVTRRLTDVFEDAGGIIGRIGGEEFGVLLPCTLAEAYQVCESARLAVGSQLVRLEDGRGVPVSVSVGLAPWCETGQSRERSLTRTYEEADRALYQAKNTGRARLVVGARAA